VYVQDYRQQACECVDDFMTRLKLQYIAGIRHTELQKELFSIAQDFTAEEALDPGRTYEASITHMKQLAEAQCYEKMSYKEMPQLWRQPSVSIISGSPFCNGGNLRTPCLRS